MVSPQSIVIRSKNYIRYIRGTLEAIHRQKFESPFEVIHIDSGSTDGTVDVIRSFNPAKLIQIRPEEYVPGCVLNQGMREASSDWVIFINSDAEPIGEDWAQNLLEVAKSQDRVGSSFSRQVPRPDCWSVFANDYERCFGPQRESAKWEYFFSMVSCVVNRATWQEAPFREDLQYAEDNEWSRRISGLGWAVLFAEKSIAMHSHNYTLREAFKRSSGDAFASAADGRKKAVVTDLIKGVGIGSFLDTAKDYLYCMRKKQLASLPHAAAVRVAQRVGRWVGYHKGWQHYHGGPSRAR